MKEIKRESTWDYDDDNGYRTVETIETWEWSDELNRYELVYLEEKETGEYIPYNESDYIRDGAVEIPQAKIEIICKEEIRKGEVEKEVREKLYQVIYEKCGEKVDNPEDYIIEFFWAGDCLYTSIDKLKNPTLTATLKKGWLF